MRRRWKRLPETEGRGNHGTMEIVVGCNLLVGGGRDRPMSHQVCDWGGSKDAKCVHDGSDTSELGLLDH